jgi:hypothetical protein
LFQTYNQINNNMFFKTKWINIFYVYIFA